MTHANSMAFLEIASGEALDIYSTGGLTKREYFAAMVLQGLSANEHLESTADIAERSVKQADALIEALNQ